MLGQRRVQLSQRSTGSAAAAHTDVQTQRYIPPCLTDVAACVPATDTPAGGPQALRKEAALALMKDSVVRAEAAGAANSDALVMTVLF